MPWKRFSALPDSYSSQKKGGENGNGKGRNGWEGKGEGQEEEKERRRGGEEKRDYRGFVSAN